MGLVRDDARQIGDARLGVQAREHVIAAWIPGQLRHAGVAVVQIAEDDRFRRARLRARGGDVTVTHGAILDPGLILRAANALHAEGALLHHALLAHRDVGIEQHGERLGEGFVLPAAFGVVVPVEVADLVRTVIRAIARADAAVVHLAVQPVGRVIRGEDGTNRFARRVAALLAEHRLIDRTVYLALFVLAPIALEPEPRHLAPPLRQVFAD